MEISVRELKDSLDWQIRMIRESIQNVLKQAIEMKAQSKGEVERRVKEVEKKLTS